ncbi:hypothetical protein ZHS_110 [Edwardsiella phage vB_EpM_ZHS]|jgi:hypothetical protein|nr:hypothetical protein ZHS_110 [Edwardsiella phage vB_EpM_ZHS]
MIDFWPIAFLVWGLGMLALGAVLGYVVATSKPPEDGHEV